ncbi:MAG: hypothetical protein FJY92_00410 [Candidatus Hydrogenedentes bacterium]|nr:hypothetical protein [Candidatus Hydrogenedentota bacterium]
MTTAVGYSPSRIVDLHAPDDAEASRRIEAAARLAGLAGTEWMHVPVLADDPVARSEAAAPSAFARARAEGLVPVANLTGATKLLAIGAYRAAERARVPCIYLELPEGDADGLPQIVHFGDAEAIAPARDPSELLTMEVIATANGYTLVDPGSDPTRYRHLADHFLNDPDSEEEAHAALPRVVGERVPHPDSPQWRAWQADFRLPPAVAALAEEAEIVVRAGVRCRLGDGGSRDDQLRRRTIERNASILNGAWFEVAVHAWLSRDPSLRDVRWSVVAERPRPLEHDMLAMKGTQVLVASCKRSIGPGIFGHVRELRTHALRLGGLKALKMLCVARIDLRPRADGTGTVGSDLAEVCDGMGIRLVTGSEVRRAFQPAKETRR